MVALVGRAFISYRKHRALTIAVVVSILLHIGLLLILPVLRDARQLPFQVRGPILARFVEPSAKPAPVAVPPAVTPDLTSSVAALVPPPVTSRAKNPVATHTLPQAVRRHVNPVAKEMPQPSSAVESALEKIDSHALARSSLILASPAPGVSDPHDTGTLAQYRLAVLGAAKRYKRYPYLALENNWQGKVEVRLSINADGLISSLVVRSSTGHSLLDQQALDMIERATAVAQIPPALRGKQFVVDIPVEFTLRDAGA